MSELICIKKNGVEIAINPATGDQYITIAGYSRLSGLSNGTIRQRCRRMIKRQLQNPENTEAKITTKPLRWSDALESIKLDTGRGVFKTLLIPMDKVAIWIKKDNPAISKEIDALIKDFKGVQ